MHQSVIDSFVTFSRPLEGLTYNPYLDVKGLVTVGLGCLIDPTYLALGLPWKLPDGSPATASEVTRQLDSLRSQQGLKSYRYDSPNVLKATTIRLDDAGVLELARKRLLGMEASLKSSFPAWDTWPADAQLFACSMAWAVGAGWPGIFGNCSRLLRSAPPQFGLCAVGASDAKPGDASAPCDIKTSGNPGIVPRNAQNRLLLTNAQLVEQFDLRRDVLYWPKSPLSEQ